MTIQSTPDPPDRYRVIAWLPVQTAPSGMARGVCHSVALSQADAVTLAQTWARVLSDPRIVVEIVRCD
jgi:hypothetical protein